MKKCQSDADIPFPLPLPPGMSVKCISADTQGTGRPPHVADRDSNNRSTAWIVEAHIPSPTSRCTWTFGRPSLGRHLCLHRFKLWWLKPCHGFSGLDVPPETSLLLAERSHSLNSPAGASNEGYVVLLPLSDTHARASLHSAARDGDRTVNSWVANDPLALALSSDTGDEAIHLPERMGVLLVAVGSDPFSLARTVLLEARRLLREQLGLGSGGRGEEGEPVPSSADFVDKFGWCTWDSFYTMVTPEGILDGLSGFQERGIRPKWVVIDDGWQRTTNDDALNTEQWDERLVALEANKRFRRFDEKGKLLLDLGDTVAKMKKKYGVEDVLTWHAMTGYWAGVESDAEELQRFHPFVAKLVAPEGIQTVDPEMQPELDAKHFGMVPSEKSGAFYRAYHTYLKENGVDGVKVDAQSILDCMGGGNGGVPAVSRAYEEGLCHSVQASFQEGDKPAPLIHCMCHAPSVLFHIAAVSRDRVVIRGSDDFYPREASSHGPHLYTNAYNALLFANIGVHDWDMFQSGLGCKGKDAVVIGDSRDGVVDDCKVGEAEDATAIGTKISWFHAAARAISGGPVYVSDQLGQHNTDILSKLVLDDGSVLRAQTNALPTLDCLMRDPQLKGGGLLQIWALNTLPGTGIVGSFNVRGSSFSQQERTWVSLEDGKIPAVQGVVSPSDVHAFTKEPPGTDLEQGAEQAEQEQESPGAGASGPPAPMYAMYLHCRKEARIVCLRESTPIEIDSLAFELATFSRVLEIRLSQAHSNGAGAGSCASGDIERDAQDGSIFWATIGLRDMLNPSAAISEQDIGVKGSDRDDAGAMPRVGISVKGSGCFLALASRTPTRTTLTTCQSASGNDDQVGDSSDLALEASFTPLPRALVGGKDSAGRSRYERDLGDMGMVEVVIPAPWDGQERRLTFVWN